MTDGATGAAADRDPIAILQHQSAGRLPDLVPLRYGRMLASPFAFLRGAAAIMTADLAALPSSGVHTQLCGDAHLLNFGLFATPERNLVFDVNDFDETHPGPFEWDVIRLATSLVVLARQRGASLGMQDGLVGMVCERYSASIAEFASAGELDVWYSRVDVDALQSLAELGRHRGERVQAEAVRARRHDAAHAVTRMTEIRDGRRRFVRIPVLVEPFADDLRDKRTRTALLSLLERYRQSLPPHIAALLDRFDVVDLARKVVGVGSVGTRCHVLLLRGAKDDDYLVLQVKEAGPSVLAAYAPDAVDDVPAAQGRRVVEGQRLVQAASDVLLGWLDQQDDDGTTRSYYIRQLRDWKSAPDVEAMTDGDLRFYAGMCAWTLARGHARAGNRHAIADHVRLNGTFAADLTAAASTLADRTTDDHAVLQRAVEDGRIAALQV